MQISIWSYHDKKKKKKKLNGFWKVSEVLAFEKNDTFSDVISCKYLSTMFFSPSCHPIFRTPINGAVKPFVNFLSALRSSLKKKVFLEISWSSQENTCARASFLIELRYRPLRRLISCEFCEISKNIFFTEQLLSTASERLSLRIGAKGTNKD